MFKPQHLHIFETALPMKHVVGLNVNALQCNMYAQNIDVYIKLKVLHVLLLL